MNSRPGGYSSSACRTIVSELPNRAAIARACWSSSAYVTEAASTSPSWRNRNALRSGWCSARQRRTSTKDAAVYGFIERREIVYQVVVFVKSGSLAVPASARISGSRSIAALRCAEWRIVSTGHGADLTTFSATLPRSACATAPRTWVPITISSNSPSTAARNRREISRLRVRIFRAIPVSPDSGTSCQL